MGLGPELYAKFIEYLAELSARYPTVTKVATELGKEQAGLYGPAIRDMERRLIEKGKEMYDTWKTNPQKVGEDYPFFPPGIFSPFPKAFDSQGDVSFQGGGDASKEKVYRLASGVLGEGPQEEEEGRKQRPFYFG